MTSQPPSGISGTRLRRGTNVAGVTLDELVVRGERVHLWRAHRSDGTQVTVHALVDDARPREVEHFLESARRLAALTRNGPIAGVADVTLVVPSERLYVSRGSAAGTMEDLSLLGWGLRDTLTFVRRLCRAMREIHRHGIVHGCARPANVLLDDNLDPRLSDVGAIVLDDSYEGPSDMKHDYSAYAAREVRLGEAATPRSDVFTIGRLIAFALTAQLPDEDDSAVPRLASLDGQPPGLQRIVRRATLRDPQRRYGSVEELMADLERYEETDRVGVGHEDGQEQERLSTPPSWRPERNRTAPLPRRGTTTDKGMPRRDPEAPRRGSSTPREMPPRREATTPRSSRRGATTPREARSQEGPPAAPAYRPYHSTAPPPRTADILTPGQAGVVAALGAAILLSSFGLAYFSGIGSSLAKIGGIVGIVGVSSIMPAVGPPWLSRSLAALIVAAAFWLFDPIAAAAGAGRESKLESGSPMERGLSLARLRERGIRDFSRIDLSGADFTGLDLTATRFDRANLRAARFDRARLSGASLQDADLTAADFAGADLTGVDVASARGWLETRCDETTVMPADWNCVEGAPQAASLFER